MRYSTNVTSFESTLYIEPRRSSIFYDVQGTIDGTIVVNTLILYSYDYFVLSDNHI